MMEAPRIEERTSSGIREVSVYSRLLRQRKVMLTGSIDEAMATDIVSQLMVLDHESEEKIELYINSPGGEVQSGLMIYDALEHMRSPVDIICMGRAASMAAVLLACGKKGHRYIYTHGKTMIHEPLIAGGVGGSATSIRNISESILRTKDLINDILVEHTGKSREEIDEATSYDNFMDAEESVKFGLCDKVI